jgi:hypothetical protein
MKHEQGKPQQDIDTAKNPGGDVWSIEGIYTHPLYSPKGGVEGIMLDADGVPAQFVFGHGPDDVRALDQLAPGQRITVEGTEAKPWPEGEHAHAVYQFKRVVNIDGKDAHDGGKPGHAKGKVVRLNHARRGEANGVLLDSGDFIHVRPDRFAKLEIVIGAMVEASGPRRPLVDGSGSVVDAIEFEVKTPHHKPG